MGTQGGRLVIGTILTISVMLMASLFAPLSAFAQQSTDDLKWQLVFISSNNSCSTFDHQETVKYNEIAEKYLKLYNLKNSAYDPLCFSQKNYSDKYIAPPDLDLSIIVYDDRIGENELHSQKLGGFYHHFGTDRSQNHVIVICDCSTFNYSNPVWILTHQLSDFALYYLGYDTLSIESYVQLNDNKYDECIKNYVSTCSQVVQQIRSDHNSYTYSVMPIYKPALQKDVKVANNDENQSVGKLNKAITDWLTLGKITKVMYSDVFDLIKDSNTLDATINPEIHFADYALEKETTWSDIYPDYAKKSSGDLFSYVPNIINPEKIIFNKDKKSDLPKGLKETETAWINGEITNDDFLNIINIIYENEATDTSKNSDSTNPITESQDNITNTELITESPENTANIEKITELSENSNSTNAITEVSENTNSTNAITEVSENTNSTNAITEVSENTNSTNAITEVSEDNTKLNTDEFQIDFETQQLYLQEMKNSIKILERKQVSQDEQKIDNLKMQLELHKKALMYYYHGNYADAVTYYDKVIEIEPQDAQALYDKGVCMAKQNMFEESIDYFNKAAEIKTRDLINKT